MTLRNWFSIVISTTIVIAIAVRGFARTTSGTVPSSASSHVLAVRASKATAVLDAPRDVQPKAVGINRYLETHPETVKQLHQNPDLINDQEFRSDHPQIAGFLSTHREFAEQVKQNPGSFMQRVRWYHRGRRITNPED